MKKDIKDYLIITVIVFACALAVWYASADIRLAHDYIRDKYGYNMDIVYSQYPPESTTEDPRGKVIVQIVKSKATAATHGKTAAGDIIEYNAPVKKGKSVTSYLIYNPATGFDDDVIAVVDNGKVR